MSEWDSVASQVSFNLEISANAFVATVPIEAKVLDFGCGYGRITHQISELGYNKVIGIDSLKEMINRGLGEYPELDLRHFSTDVLPFSDNEFDSIITCAVFTCIPNKSSREQVLSELRRVLKPNGVIYLAEFCSDVSLHFVSGTGVSMWHSKKVELEELLEDFSIESSTLVDTPTMSGHKSKASHIIARKI
ncbi:class I SAM-dependent methyltransferase [Vibrio marisflavi]|uniref:2-methoxy-6-polyprenyl-1,4-benzoquinol methylase, mitochondrial n=1 Tax=Vibrio marisflavi CECT 7928 TaxID=634439 RepID=A0ABN8E2M8_9VIBR|nr:class I SAM-dependent methyltransferase [Vibrio marisflavi]CAH0536641.1 2-methoxy-6-polyprenyl-1,4-benzoquinol methylase, mitochondrial [Vibrio marisflavi CECT 7928]